MKNGKRRFIPTALEKRLLSVFAVTAALSWASFRYLRLIPALAVLLVGAAVLWWMLRKYLVKPIQALTMAVLECRPTRDGFSFKPQEIRTSDELELLANAIKRMTDDMSRAKREGGGPT